MSIAASKFFALDPGQLTAELEDRFFTGLKTANNTFKRTATGRFGDVDDMCLRAFERAQALPRDLLDIGVSSGTTTIELADRLRRAGAAPRIVATDVALQGWLVSVCPGLSLLADEAANPLQYEVFGLAVRAWRRRADRFTGVAPLLGLLERAGRARAHAALARRDGRARAVPLLSPRLAARGDIAVERNDIFVADPAFVGRFDLVRAANILNRGYFDEQALATAFANIGTYLRGPGAWLLVARTRGERNAATLFRVAPDGGRLIVADRVGEGSEVERIALAATLRPAPMPA